MTRLGGIDAGGTSWRCAIFEGKDVILARTSFPTTTPEATLQQAVAFFQHHQANGLAVEAVGVACFGPLAVDPKHPRWGHILETTKLGWSGTDVAGTLAKALQCPVAIETDVTAAAFAERAWGAGRGVDDVAYVTVGTGIGAGIIVGGHALWGAMHPEAGHMRAPRHPRDMDFEGVCRFHGDCIEGLASAPALRERWGEDASNLPDSHPAWEIEAHYLGHLAANLVFTTAVRLVIFGGGVMARPGLVGLIAAKAKALVGPYGLAATDENGFKIVAAGLGLDSGLFGALWLAEQATT